MGVRVFFNGFIDFKVVYFGYYDVEEYYVWLGRMSDLYGFFVVVCYEDFVMEWN